MATVNQIINRLAREDPFYGIYRPGLGTSRTELIPVVEDYEVSMKPNRKITVAGVAGAVATILVFVAYRYLNIDLNDAAVSGLTALIAAGLGYLVPEKSANK